MNTSCPQCKEPMDEGIAILETNFVSSLFVGASRMFLYFRKFEARKQIKILDPYLPYDSYHCSFCEITTLIHASRYDD